MKKIIWIFCLAFFCSALGGCGEETSKDSGSGAAESGDALVVGTMPDVDSIPLVIAEEKGFFKEEGVNVVLRPFKSAMDRDSALQSGNLDGAISDLLAAAFQKEGGFDVKATSATAGSYKLVAGKSEAISTASDLKDKDVALSKNTIIEYVTDRIAGEAKLKEGDFHKVIVPQIPARLEMLQNGKIAAVTLPEPLASVAIADGAKLVSSSDELNINPGVMLFTAKAAADKQKEIAALYRAYNKAVNYLNQETPESYIDLVIEKCGFPPAVRGALRLPRYEKAEPPLEKDVTECIEWMNERGLIHTRYEYGALATDSFVK